MVPDPAPQHLLWRIPRRSQVPLGLPDSWDNLSRRVCDGAQHFTVIPLLSGFLGPPPQSREGMGPRVSQ